MKRINHLPSRRQFLKSAAGAMVAFPTIIPATVLGDNAPSKRVTIGCIGMGRMGRGDAQDFLRLEGAQVVAVCDVDSRRLADGRELVEKHYGAATASGTWRGCASFEDFRELISREDIDAVSIVTPDHWHAIHTVESIQAGKDIFLQKPLTYTIREGRILSEAVRRHERVLQVGSQQRSDARFRQACELVRNGRIGEVKLVKVGFDLDPSGEVEPDMPVPRNLNYDLWLGPAPAAPYTEKRVHPQHDYSRPGWLRIQDYCHGMITGWGSHHLDIAQWGLGVERSGPVGIQARAEFPGSGLWNVHGKFRIDYTYSTGASVICAGTDENKQGVEFIGADGWIHVQRGRIDAFPKSVLDSDLAGASVRLYRSDHHKGNFLACIRSRAETVAPVEIGHRSNTTCLLGAIAMRLGRKLQWDPTKEEFRNDPEANALCSRAGRKPWVLKAV